MRMIAIMAVLACMAQTAVTAGEETYICSLPDPETVHGHIFYEWPGDEETFKVSEAAAWMQKILNRHGPAGVKVLEVSRFEIMPVNAENRGTPWFISCRFVWQVNGKRHSESHGFPASLENPTRITGWIQKILSPYGPNGLEIKRVLWAKIVPTDIEDDEAPWVLRMRISRRQTEEEIEEDHELRIPAQEIRKLVYSVLQHAQQESKWLD